MVHKGDHRKEPIKAIKTQKNKNDNEIIIPKLKGHDRLT